MRLGQMKTASFAFGCTWRSTEPAFAFDFALAFPLGDAEGDVDFVEGPAAPAMAIATLSFHSLWSQGQLFPSRQFPVLQNEQVGI